MQYQFRPIQKWPRPFAKNRRRSPFQATYPQTLELLEGELSKINARNVVIQLALDEADIRRDGVPRARSRPEHPGVILAFEKWMPTRKVNDKGQPLGIYRPLSFPCDAFTDWESNLRAIALSLEALRKVDRYGVTQSGEQYTGWAALPSPDGAIETREQAAQFITRHSGIVVTADHTDANALQRAYREAAKRLHPDADGDHESFTRLQTAYALLKT